MILKGITFAQHISFQITCWILENIDSVRERMEMLGLYWAAVDTQSSYVRKEWKK